MTNREKIELLEEIMELERGVISEETELSEIDEWDSMAALSLIVLMDEKFNKKITAKQIREFITVKDICNCME